MQIKNMFLWFYKLPSKTNRMDLGPGRRDNNSRYIADICRTIADICSNHFKENYFIYKDGS